MKFVFKFNITNINHIFIIHVFNKFILIIIIKNFIIIRLKNRLLRKLIIWNIIIN